MVWDDSYLSGKGPMMEFFQPMNYSRCFSFNNSCIISLHWINFYWQMLCVTSLYCLVSDLGHNSFHLRLVAAMPLNLTSYVSVSRYTGLVSSFNVMWMEVSHSVYIQLKE